MTRTLSPYETYDFWFNNKDHDEWDQWNNGYYVNSFYKDIVFDLEIPADGYIVVTGTARCVSFDLLCNKFGADRCIGFDLYNPTDHPRVTIKDCLELCEQDDIPIAFAHNDVGNMLYTPELKIHTHKWLAKNIVKGGWLLGPNNLNRAKFQFEEYLMQQGFNNTHFIDLGSQTKNIPQWIVDGKMISQKV